jgi:Large polyvalent protein associated domain 38
MTQDGTPQSNSAPLQSDYLSQTPTGTPVPGRDQLGGSLLQPAPPKGYVDTAKYPLNVFTGQILAPGPRTVEEMKQTGTIGPRDKSLAENVSDFFSPSYHQDLANMEQQRAMQEAAAGVNNADALLRMNKHLADATAAEALPSVVTTALAPEALGWIGEAAGPVLGPALQAGFHAQATVYGLQGAHTFANNLPKMISGDPIAIKQGLLGLSDTAFMAALNAGHADYSPLATETGLANATSNGSTQSPAAGDIGGWTPSEVKEAMSKGWTVQELTGTDADANRIQSIRDAMRNNQTASQWRAAEAGQDPKTVKPDDVQPATTSMWEDFKNAAVDALMQKAPRGSKEAGAVDLGRNGLSDDSQPKKNIPSDGQTPEEKSAVKSDDNKAALEDAAAQIVARNNAMKERLATQAGQTGQDLQKMVEGAGGIWTGLQDGLAHFDVHPSLVNGDTYVSLAMPPEMMTDDSVKYALAAKAQEWNASMNDVSPVLRAAMQRKAMQVGEARQASLVRTDQPAESDDVEAPAEPRLLPFTENANLNKLAQMNTGIEAAKIKERITGKGQDVQTLVDKRDNFKTWYLMKPVQKLVQKADEATIKKAIAEHSVLSTDLAKRGEAGIQLTAIHHATDEAYKSLVELKHEGGPIRQVQSIDEYGRPTTVNMKPTDPLGGRWARQLLRNLSGQVQEHALDDIIPHPKPAGRTDEEHAEAQEWLHNRRNQVEQEARQAFEEYKNHPKDGDRLRALLEKLQEYNDASNMYGSAPITSMIETKPRNLKVQLGEHGELLFPEAMPRMTLKRARVFMGKNVEKMPTKEELFLRGKELIHKAGIHAEIAEMYRNELKARQKKREGERGSFAIQGKKLPVKAKNVATESEEFTLESLTKNLAKHGIKVVKVDENNSIWDGWLIGKYGWENGALNHNDSMALAAPMTEARGSAMKVAMTEHRAVRVSFVNGQHQYEVGAWDSKMADQLEMDMIYKSATGLPLTIDITRKGGILPVEIAPNWSNLFSAVKSQLPYTKATPEEIRSGEVHASPLGSSPLPSHLMAGTAVALALSFHIGGPLAGIPHLHDMSFAAMVSPQVLARVYSYLRARVFPWAANVLPSNRFVNGAPQNPSSLSPRLDRIREAQWKDQAHNPISVVQRLANLPGNILQRWVDERIFLRQDLNALNNFIMQWDNRGLMFRDINGRPNTDDTIWDIVRQANGIIHGQEEVNNIDFRNIISDAKNTGNYEKLLDYLNLKGYKRAYNNLKDRFAELRSQKQAHDQALQQPNLSPRERIDHQDESVRLSGEMYSLSKQLQAGTVVPEQLLEHEIDQMLQQMQAKEGKNFAVIKALGDRYFKMLRQGLDMLHAWGLITDEAYQTYTARGDEYVPLRRIMSDLQMGYDRSHPVTNVLWVSQEQAIREMFGSERVNKDPFDAASRLLTHMISEVARNRVQLQALHIATQTPELHDLYVSIGTGSKPEAGHIRVPVWTNGKRMDFSVPEWYGVALMSNPTAAKEGMDAYLRWNMAMQRKVLTHGNILFSVRNAIRHFGDMFLMSDAGVSLDPRKMPADAMNFIKTWISSFLDTIHKNDVWKSGARQGFLFSTASRQINPEDRASLTDLGWKGKLARGQVIELVRDANAAIEDTNKLTTYKRMIAKGFSQQASGREAMTYGGAPPFDIKGTQSGWMGAIAMFANARMRYWSRTASKFATSPARMGILLAAVTMLNMGIGEWNYRQYDSHGNNMLRKISPYERDTNFIFITPFSETRGTGAEMPIYFKAPKPSWVRYIGNPIEGVVDKVLGVETRSAKQIMADAITDQLPVGGAVNADNVVPSSATALANTINPALKVPVEELANQTQFGPIVPDSQKKLLPEAQGKPTTSPTAIAMGKGGMRGAKAGAVPGAIMGHYVGGWPGTAVGAGVGAAVGAAGASPLRVEHTIRGLLGGAADVALGVSDELQGGQSRPLLPPSPTERIGHLPVVGSLAGIFLGHGADNMMSELNEKFYRLADRATSHYETFNNLLKQGKKGDAEVFMRFHQRDIQHGANITEFRKALNDLGNAEKVWMYKQDIPNVTPEKRKAMLTRIYQLRLKVLQKGIDQLEDKNPSGNTVTTPGAGQGNASR